MLELAKRNPSSDTAEKAYLDSLAVNLKTRHRRMRTIKFRGKEISTGKWVFGFYTKGSFTDPYKGKETIRHIIHADFLHDVDPDTVGQFTGLKDCMGREVYEGDIVMYDGSPEFGRRLVVFYEESFNIATWQEYECLQRLAGG